MIPPPTEAALATHDLSSRLNFANEIKMRKEPTGVLHARFYHNNSIFSHLLCDDSFFDAYLF